MKESLMITGATGFAGRHHMLRASDLRTPEGDPFQLIAVGRDATALQQLQVGKPHITPASIDIAKEPLAVEDLLKLHKPKYLIHLAAYPAPASTSAETIDNNNGATKNILEAVLKHSPDTTVIVTTSVVVYGNQEGALQENSQLPEQYENAYAQSKRNDITLIEKYREKGLNIIEGRVFNHTGPGHEKGLYAGIIRKAVEAKGQNKPFQDDFANLAYGRDLQDVRNWADASIQLAQNAQEGTFNICGGKSISLQAFLEKVSEATGVTVEVVDEKKPIEPLVTWGDNTRLQSIGWTPAVPLDKTIEDSVENLLKQKSAA